MKKYHSAFFLILLFVFLLFLALNNLVSFHVLTIQDFSNADLIFLEIFTPGEGFLLKYTHSVARTPVWEFFTLSEDGKLILTETHFQDHGAGLPYTTFDKETFIIEEGKFKIKNMSREIWLPLYVRIGENRENYFIHEGRSIDLSNRLGDAVISINIIRMNLFHFILNKFII